MEEIKDRGRSSLMLSHHRKKERTNIWLFYNSRKQGCCSLLIYFFFPVECRLEWFVQRCCSFCSKFVWTHQLMPYICCNLFFATVVLENLRQLFLLTAFWLDSKSWRIILQGKTGASIRCHDIFLQLWFQHRTTVFLVFSQLTYYNEQEKGHILLSLTLIFSHL